MKNLPPFWVLPPSSFEGMSAPSAPSASRTQPYGWGSSRKNPKSKLQSPDQKACLPNTCVCPPVCPTATSPKADAFWWKIWLFDPYVFPVIKAAVFYMEFWFMTGLPQELGQSFLQMSKLEITKQVCNIRVINVLFPKNLEQTPKMRWEKKWMGKFSREFCLRVQFRGRVHLPRKNLSTAPLRATLGTLRAGSPSGFSLNSSRRSECS